MPKITDLIEQRKTKSFSKKNYRPWDLHGEEIHLDINQESTKPILDIKETSIAKTKDTDKKSNLVKLDIDSSTIRNQSDNNPLTKQETIDSDLGIVLDNKLDNNKEQKDLIFQLKNLVGTQESIFYFVINICCKLNQLETGAISTHDVSIAADCSYGTTKVAIKRLIDKGLLIRKQGRTSKGGYINLGITNAVKILALQSRQEKERTHFVTQSLLANKKRYKDINIENNLGNNIGNTLDNSSISNSSNINNKIITTLSEEWQKINFEPLAEIGFSETQLRQLYEKNLDPEMIQQSILHFAWGLENNTKIREKYPDPLNTLMGVLRKGGIWTEANYESPEIIAMRQMVEIKKREKEKKQKLLMELAEIEFPEWRGQLSQEEVKKYLPEKVANYKNPPEETVELYLKEVFISQILPEKFKLGEVK